MRVRAFYAYNEYEESLCICIFYVVLDLKVETFIEVKKMQRCPSQRNTQKQNKWTTNN
jgi:hypothetical protein